MKCDDPAGGCRLECVPVPSAGPAFKEPSGCLWGRAPQKSISRRHKLFELCNLRCVIAGRGMCDVCVCSRSCRGVVWVDCISAHLYLFLSLQYNLMVFHSASGKEAGQLWLDKLWSSITNLATGCLVLIVSGKELFSHLIHLLYLWTGRRKRGKIVYQSRGMKRRDSETESSASEGKCLTTAPPSKFAVLPC